jgi:hypothetical protein
MTHVHHSDNRERHQNIIAYKANIKIKQEVSDF